MKWLSQCLIGAAIFLAAQPAAADECHPSYVDLKGEWGQARFSVETVDTPESRSQGLMHRTKLASSAGMLFVYEQPQKVAFWMKNTLIPLDMIFVDITGRVVSLHEGAIPGDLTPIPGEGMVFAVLEVNAGVVERYGISVGTVLHHEAFLKKTAIWPC